MLSGTNLKTKPRKARADLRRLIQHTSLVSSILGLGRPESNDPLRPPAILHNEISQGGRDGLPGCFVLISSWRDDLFIRRPCLPCEYQNPLLPDKMPMRASTDDARTESIPIPFSVHAHCLRTGLLLLLLPQGEQTDTGNLDDLEPHTGNITLGLALTTETSQEHLVVLVHEVQATVVGDCRVITCQLITCVLSRLPGPHGAPSAGGKET